MRYFIIAIALFICSISIAQRKASVYYDCNWNTTTADKACYYRTVEDHPSKKGSVIAKDFYATGELQMEGTYSSLLPEVKNGKFTWWYKTGEKKSEVHYVNGHKQGERTWWDKKGNVMEKGTLTSGAQHGTWKGWHANRNLSYEGSYVNGQREKEWKWYHSNGGISAKEVYKGGALKKATYWNEKGGKVAQPLANSKASFPGGITALNAYVKEHLSQGLADGGFHQIIVLFEVTPQGKAKHINVVQGINPKFNEALKQVLRTMPTWKPAINHNRKEPEEFKLVFDY